MPFRRHSAAKSTKTLRALRAAIEPLENRCLLTACVNGVFTGTNTAFDGTNVFEYRQSTGTSVRISVFGNVTAEFIGGQVGGAGVNPVTLRDLVPAGTTQTAVPGIVYLFSVYVVHADINSAISISPINNNGRMTPFGGTIPINAASGQFTVSNGAAYIGVKSTPGTGGDVPYILADRKAFGMRPSSAGAMYAGLEVAPGNDLGKFFLGGTITGIVDVPGNMDEFYAGNIFTGDIDGVGSTGVSTIKNNFHISGNINDLLTLGEISADALTIPGDVESFTYKSGVQLDIGGRIGQLETNNSIVAAMTVHNDKRVKGTGLPQHEVESIGVALPNNGAASYFDPTYYGYAISIGELTQNAAFTNDTFANAQALGSATSSAMKNALAIQVVGSIGNSAAEGVDYYSVALMAGQTIDVQLLDQATGLTSASHPRLGIFDPEGRLIATDYNNVNFDAKVNDPIRFTAQRAGSYRFAVSLTGDAAFTGTTTGSGIVYDLRITGAGDLAVGGIVATIDVGTMDAVNEVGGGGTSIQVDRGDLGEVRAGDTIFSAAPPWRVSSGNLRSMIAASIGIDDPRVSPEVIVLGSGPELLVPKGSIGAIRQTAANRMLSLNDDATFMPFPTVASALDQTSPSLAVGKNIQLVEAAGSLEGVLLANGAIGVIRAGTVGTKIGQPVWQVNVDKKGTDGVIDLIDVTGDLGTLSAGGPAITTGPGGNVRYMRVVGATYRDLRFGFGTGTRTYSPGVKAIITDDSGTQVVLTPTPQEPQPTGSTSTNPLFDPPQLAVTTYPVRDKGGAVIVNVTVTPFDDTTDGIVATGGAGLTVKTGSNGSHGSAEIGTIDISGVAAADTFTFDQYNRTYVLAAQPAAPALPIRDTNLLFTGSSLIDVFDIIGGGQAVTSIKNQTKGEIVNIEGTPSVFDLEGETLGLARSTTGTAVEGLTVRNNVYPFVNQKNLIELTDVATIKARRGLGNIQAVNIGNVTANSDNANVKGVFEGINAPVVALNPNPPTDIAGNIVSVDIGEGLAPSGTGAVGLSGIYASGLLDKVVGRNGADIRGNVIAEGVTVRSTAQAVDPVSGAALTNPDGTPLMVSTPNFDIGRIQLTGGGSIVDANIMAVDAFTQALETNLTYLSTEVQPTIPDTFENPFYEIDSIIIDGGGMLGDMMVGLDIGLIQVKNGYGVLNTAILSTEENVTDGIITDGYGVRNVTMIGGARINQIIAKGNGGQLAANKFSSAVRFSEKGSFDPYSGATLDGTNDLDKYLGTTKSKPKVSGVTVTGVVQDSTFIASTDFGTLQAQRVIAKNVFVTDPITHKRSKIPYGAAEYPMVINVGNKTGSIIVRDNIDGLSMQSGTVDTMRAGKFIQNSSINVRGNFGTLSANTMRSSASFLVDGPDGQIGTITTTHDLASIFKTSNSIKSVSVGGNMLSKTFNVGSNLNSLTVNGSVLTGSSIAVNGTLTKLLIKHDLKARATIRAHAIKSQQILGQVIGDIIIA